MLVFFTGLCVQGWSSVEWVLDGHYSATVMPWCHIGRLPVAWRPPCGPILAALQQCVATCMRFVWCEIKPARLQFLLNGTPAALLAECHMGAPLGDTTGSWCHKWHTSVVPSQCDQFVPVGCLAGWLAGWLATADAAG